MRLLPRFFREQEGQDLTEYGLLAAFIAIASVLTIRNFGPLIDALYQLVEAAFN